MGRICDLHLTNGKGDGVDTHVIILHYIKLYQRREILLTWKGKLPSHKRKCGWPLYAKNRPQMTARKYGPRSYSHRNWILPIAMWAERGLQGPQKNAAQAQILIAALWNPEQKIHQSDTQAPDPQKLPDNKCRLFKLLSLWNFSAQQ